MCKTKSILISPQNVVVSIMCDKDIIQLKLHAGGSKDLWDIAGQLEGWCNLTDTVYSEDTVILAEALESVSQEIMVSMIQQKMMDLGWTDKITIMAAVQAHRDLLLEEGYLQAESDDDVKNITTFGYSEFLFNKGDFVYPALVKVTDTGFNSDSKWSVEAIVHEDFVSAYGKNLTFNSEE